MALAPAPPHRSGAAGPATSQRPTGVRPGDHRVPGPRLITMSSQAWNRIVCNYSLMGVQLVLSSSGAVVNVLGTSAAPGTHVVPLAVLIAEVSKLAS